MNRVNVKLLIVSIVGCILATGLVEADEFDLTAVSIGTGIDTYLNILFSKSNYWNYAVFQWSDARLTSANGPMALLISEVQVP